MTIQELEQIFFALVKVYGKERAEELFRKLVKHITL